MQQSGDQVAGGRRVGLTGSSRGWRSLDYLLAIGLVAAALLARLPALDPPTLWFDDAWQALAMRTDGWVETMAVSGTNPLFAIVLSLLPSGTDLELTAQMPALLAGLATPLVLYLGSRRLGLGVPASLLAGAIGASSPVLIAYSARAKPYTADAFLASVFILCAVAFVRFGSRRALYTTLVVAPLGILTSGHTAILYIPALLWVVWNHPRWRLSSRTVGSVGVAATGLAYYGLFLRARISPALKDYWDYGFVAGDSVADSVTGVLEAMVSFGTLTVPIAFPSVVVGAVVLAAMVGGIVLVAAKDPKVGILLLAPLVAAVVASVLGMAPFGTGRTDAYLMPVVALLLAIALAGVESDDAPQGDWMKTRTSVLVALAGVSLATGILLQIEYPETSPVIKDIAANHSGDGSLILVPLADIPYGLYAGQDFEVVSAPDRENGFRLEFQDPSLTTTVGAPDTCAQVTLFVASRDRKEVNIAWSHPGNPEDAVVDCVEALGYRQTAVAGTEGQRVTVLSR